VSTVRDKTAQELDDEKEPAAVCHTSTSVTCALVLEVIEQAGKDIPNPTVVAAIKPSWSPAWKRPNPSLIVAILASGRSSGESVRREGELAQPGHGQT